MKICILLAAVLCIGYISGEQCTGLANCKETLCKNEDGWWLHCTKGFCACQHDSFTGAACPSGTTADCTAAHGTRCEMAQPGLHWRCVDQVCHCTKH